VRFDAEDVALPGDVAVSERLLQKPPAEHKLKPRRRVGRVLLLASAALLLASAAAALGGFFLLWSKPNAPLVPSVREVLAPPSVPPKAVANVVAPEPAVPLPSVSANAPRVDEPPASAAELLSAAGQARRQGKPVRALALLETLRARHPTSAEARASDITLRLEAG
jgi:hypothetical protein